MLKAIKRVLFKSEVIVSFLIIFLFFFIRLYHLKLLPIFVDEAIYARWAQQGLYDSSARFASLVDGKQPMYIWLTSILMHIISNPIAAGRIVSILSGFATLIGLFLLSLELFKNKWVGLISAFFYAIYPFALVMNRMALYESLVGMFGIWSLYLLILTVRHANLGRALTLGLIWGGSILTKTSGFINIYLFPVALLLLFNFKKDNYSKLFKWFLFILLAWVISLLYYSILFLSDKNYMVAEKDALFVYHFSELLPYHAFEKWGGQIWQLLQWTSLYLTYPAALFVLFSFVGKKHSKEKLLLFLWFIIPILSLGLMGRSPSPRYIFSMTLFLLPLIAISVLELKFFLRNKLTYGLVILTCISFIVFSDYKIITNIARAPIPAIDLKQYVNDSSSGQGLREIVSYLQQQASKESIAVATEGTYGSLPTTVIEIYFAHNANVKPYSFDTRPKNLPMYLYEEAKKKSVYIILNETQVVNKWPIDLIMKFRRGEGNLFLSLYRINKGQDILN